VLSGKVDTFDAAVLRPARIGELASNKCRELLLGGEIDHQDFIPVSDSKIRIDILDDPPFNPPAPVWLSSFPIMLQLLGCERITRIEVGLL